ncbi:NAD(P)/FAD-dependent oxidoreductase [Streptomyces paradoxus]|uniref:NAD(P)/FAD-dependent oxidoreductase n=1 Tax=Streptomyces paradoxus TaxID=66375 RepID=UPI0037FF068A
MSADLAVVGGGIIGSFVAHRAARLRPDWRTVVLERDVPARGATAWSAGADFPLAATPQHHALVTESRRLYDELRDTPAGLFVRPVRMVYVVAGDRLQDFRRRSVADLVPADQDDLDRMHRMLPGLRWGAGDHAVTHRGHGTAVVARGLTEALLADCVRDGHTAVQIGQRVERVERAADGYRLTAGGHEWEARHVVVAVGPWDLPQPLPPGLRAAVPEARRKRVAALHAQLPVRIDDPLVYFVDDDLFVLPLGEGQALVSFRRDSWDGDPETLDGRADAADLHEGTAALAARSSRAADAVVGGRAFHDLYTPGRLPLVHTAPGMPGLAAVVGGSGSGVRLAPALAARALDSVLGPLR